MDDEVFVNEYYVEYKGCWGSLTLTDQMLHFRADPPRKSTIKLSWLLLDKLQVSVTRKRLSIVTKSGKTATFTVKDRETLDNVRGDMKQFVQTAHDAKKSASAKPPQPYRRQSSITAPITRMFQGALDYYYSTSTRHISANNAKHEDPEIRQLKLKYAADIARNPQINDLDNQINQLQRQMQQVQWERRQFQRTQEAQLNQDKSHWKSQQYELQTKLDRITRIINEDEDISEDPSYYIARRAYTKAVQKASAKVAHKAAPPVLTNGNRSANGAQINAKRKTQKQILDVETNLCQIMHFSMCLQHQISVLKKNKLLVSSYLEREKLVVTSELAQDQEFQQLLDNNSDTSTTTSSHYEQWLTQQEAALEQLRELMSGHGPS
ncbi:expressed unknown protein [Seminavis robusta]|uniref:GRAM domain-containing protein n=1 Tax=Seminavis robusta TaxID=568900 RepID=A0A9N8E5H1_9STRA|nr:expressed unknown protein [Seminavis robusta]|eukprot:Sro693_g188210.1 n/a (379) ;mRNA; r:7703-8839